MVERGLNYAKIRPENSGPLYKLSSSSNFEIVTLENIDSYENILTPEEQSELRGELGISWSRFNVSAQLIGVKAAVFRTKKVLPEFIYDMAALEGNPYTFPEVQTLLEGITVGGRKLSDQEQILTIRDAWHNIIKKVSAGSFALDKELFFETQALAAKYEALEQGMFRTIDVGINGTKYTPPPHAELENIFEKGMKRLKAISNVHERAYAFFLWASYQQFFSDGNKRSSRLMTTGELLSHGFDTPSIPAAKKLEFNKKMIGFYDTGDASEMMEFLNECLPK